jgi:hypothetical protein
MPTDECRLPLTPVLPWQRPPVTRNRKGQWQRGAIHSQQRGFWNSSVENR